jgi:6-pyruvoyltetrahydropterin/6-carboxytetrahydropterin synthase
MIDVETILIRVIGNLISKPRLDLIELHTLFCDSDYTGITNNEDRRAFIRLFEQRYCFKFPNDSAPFADKFVTFYYTYGVGNPRQRFALSQGLGCPPGWFPVDMRFGSYAEKASFWWRVRIKFLREWLNDINNKGMKGIVTKEVKWEAGHRLFSPDLSKEENENVYGKCFNIHGHSYKLQVSVSSTTETNGMIINFVDLKNQLQFIVDKYDHRLILTKGDPLIPLVEPVLKDGLLVIDKPSTVENQGRLIFGELISRLPTLRIESIKLWETETSFFELKPEST